MRILFIGNENLQNEAIFEVLQSQDDYEVNHYLPIQVEEQAVEPNPQIYQVALVDLDSFAYAPDVCVAMIKKNNLTECIIAMHTYTTDKLIEPILKAGADHYFSMHSDSNELLDVLKRMSDSRK